jgi:ribokinase
VGVKVAVVGSINIDLVTQVARFPEPGETILGGDLKTIAGGKGANQAVAAARLGAEVAMVGRVGDDVFASRLRQKLVEDGIDVTYVFESVDSASGVALIVVNKEGQNSIVVASGANARLTPHDVDKAAEAIRSADVLLLQLEVPLETICRAAKIAQKENVKVVLNPAPAQQLPADILSLVDILIPNESELNTLSGVQTTNLKEMKTAAATLSSSGVEAVILTAGQNGALLAGKTGVRQFPAFSVKQVVDTTAAGDAFVGGVATAIAEGKRISEAVPRGNAAGALTITRAGAQPSLPSRAEVETLLKGATMEQRQGIEL